MLTVGFTYDLRDDYLRQGFTLEQSAEFDSLETIEAIDAALTANGFKVERIGNIKALVTALAAGKQWDIVFNICEGVKGVGREAQVPALLEAYGIPFVFSSSDVMSLTMNKAVAKLVIAEKGLPTAKFHVVEHEGDVAQVKLPFPVFAKPLAEGTGKGISAKSLIADGETLFKVCQELLKEYQQPVLVDTYLSGRDLTVGIIGRGDTAHAVAVMETTFKENADQAGQSYFNKENCEEVLIYQQATDAVAEKAAAIALKCWQALGCVDGGRVDLRCDAAGTPHFLEVNPLAGLHPTHSDLPILAAMVGVNHQKLIGQIMHEALQRHGLAMPAKGRGARASA